MNEHSGTPPEHGPRIRRQDGTTRAVRVDLRSHGIRVPRQPHEHATPAPSGLGKLAVPLTAMLLIVEVTLVTLHLLVPRTLLFNLDLDREANVPTWFSGVQLGLLAAVLAACWLEEATRPKARRPASLGLGWLLLALGFAALSMDEIAQMHEHLGWHLAHAESIHESLVGAGQEMGARHLATTGIAWVVLLSPLAAASLGYLVAFLILRFRDDRKLLFAGSLGVLLFGAALACEFLSLWTFKGTGYRLQVALEEASEMMGVTLFLLVGLSVLEHHLGGDRERIAKTAGVLRRTAVGVGCAAVILVSTLVSWMGAPLDTGRDPAPWSASSSGVAPRRSADHAFDRDVTTRWTSLGTMDGDEWFQLDLGKPAIVRRVCLFVGGFRMDKPRRLTVESSMGGTVLTPWIEDVALPLGRSSLQCVSSDLELPIQHLRFSQTGTSQHYAWSIAEIYVY